MNVLFNIKPLNTIEMEENDNYVQNFINKAEKGFDEWIEEKTVNLSVGQKAMLAEKIQATKTAVKSTLDKAIIEFNSLIGTVDQMKGTFPGSKKAVEFIERKAKEIFEKAVNQSWAFLKNQLPLLIPKKL